MENPCQRVSGVIEDVKERRKGRTSRGLAGMSVETFPGLPMFVVVAMENLDRASAVRRDAVNQAAIHLSLAYIYYYIYIYFLLFGCRRRYNVRLAIFTPHTFC